MDVRAGCRCQNACLFSRIWRAWPKLLAGCLQGYPVKNFLFGLIFRSWNCKRRFCCGLSKDDLVELHFALSSGDPWASSQSIRSVHVTLEGGWLALIGDRFGESLGGSQASPSFWKVPGLPRKFPKLPRKFFGDFPRSSLTVELICNPGVPGSFPDFPGSSPDFPGSSLDFPRGQPLSLGSLTPFADSQKLSLI